MQRTARRIILVLKTHRLVELLRGRRGAGFGERLRRSPQRMSVRADE